jgi:hypothetical protein
MVCHVLAPLNVMEPLLIVTCHSGTESVALGREGLASAV